MQALCIENHALTMTVFVCYCATNTQQTWTLYEILELKLVIRPKPNFDKSIETKQNKL